MKKFIALLLLLGSAVLAQAAEPQIPTQKIVGAEEAIPAGEIVILQPSTIDTPPANLVSVSYGWTVVEDGKIKKRVLTEKDGSIVFGAGLQAKKVLVILSVSYVYNMPGDKPQIVQAQRVITTEVTITGGCPPGPQPNPPPGPSPIPDGKFKLGTLAYQLATTKVNLPAPTRVQACQAIAQSMKTIVASIAAGRLTSAADILKETKTANNAALKAIGVDPSAWDSFSLELKRTLTSLNSQKLLATPADFQEAWGEIANGLSNVK